MNIDVDTFLTTVYCMVDDLYRAHYAPLKPVRPGKKAKMSDSEVLTVVILAQWQTNRSERDFVRYVHKHWRGYFPSMLSQSAFNRRARDLCGVLCHLGPKVCQELTQSLAEGSDFQVLDTVPVPLMRRCRGNRHRLFANEAGIGKGGADKQWFYGVDLLLSVQPNGAITGFVVGPANTEDRWFAEALLRWRRFPEASPPRAEELAEVLPPAHRHQGRRLGPTGPIASWLGVGQYSQEPYLADLGFRGVDWIHHWFVHYGARVLTKADYETISDPHERHKARRWLNGLRQVIETVNGCLDDRLGLKFPRARTYWGLLTRLAAKVAAHNVAVHVNYLFDRSPFAAFDPLS